VELIRGFKCFSREFVSPRRGGEWEGNFDWRGDAAFQIDGQLY